MLTYFVSFSSTFESLLTGKLTTTDLANGTLVFGCSRKHVLLPYDQVPIEVLLQNRRMSNQDPKSAKISRKLIDGDVLEMWDHFAAQIRRANLENRLIFMNEIGHPSYRTFSHDAVERGDRVFWKGGWVKPDAAVKAPVPVPMRPPVAMPDDAFIEQILSESAIGTRSIHGYSH